MINHQNKYLSKCKQVFAAPIFLFKTSKHLYSYLQVTLGTFLAISFNVSAVACPEINPERLDFQKITTKTIIETSDRRKFSCWTELKSQPLKFQGSTYDVTIHCHKSLTIYSHLDGSDHVVIDSNGSKSIYQADFLGDKYDCNAQGQTMIKPWIYQRKANVIKQTDYQYTPYKSI